MFLLFSLQIDECGLGQFTNFEGALQCSDCAPVRVFDLAISVCSWFLFWGFKTNCCPIKIGCASLIASYVVFSPPFCLKKATCSVFSLRIWLHFSRVHLPIEMVLLNVLHAVLVQLNRNLEKLSVLFALRVCWLLHLFCHLTISVRICMCPVCWKKVCVCVLSGYKSDEEGRRECQACGPGFFSKGVNITMCMFSFIYFLCSLTLMLVCCTTYFSFALRCCSILRICELFHRPCFCLCAYASIRPPLHRRSLSTRSCERSMSLVSQRHIRR